MAANPDLETGQLTYDSEFLKSIRSAPTSTGPELAPGERKVIGSVAEAQSTGLREWLFASQPKPGNYEVTLDTSRQVLRLDIPEDYKNDFRSKEKSDEPPLYPSFTEAGLDPIGRIKQIHARNRSISNNAGSVKSFFISFHSFVFFLCTLHRSLLRVVLFAS